MWSCLSQQLPPPPSPLEASYPPSPEGMVRGEEKTYSSPTRAEAAVLERLEAENQALREEKHRLEVSNHELQIETLRWQHVTSDMINSVVLCPLNCEKFKRAAREHLVGALARNAFDVNHIDVSCPSSKTNAPSLRLLRHDPDVHASEWAFTWAPSWSATVSLNSHDACNLN